MKFRCGESWEERKTRVDRMCTWHTWYAWHPISIDDGHCRWLETVERKYLVKCYKTAKVPIYRDVTK